MDENEKAFRKLINSYSELETKLLDEIVEHFNINEEFINSDYWRLEKLEELGLLSENVVEYIANATKKTPNEIKKAIETIGFNNVRMDELNKAYKGGFLQIDPNILLENATIQNLINYSYNTLTDRFLEMSNKIEQGTRQAYLDIVEKVYLQTTQGVTYQEAIRSALLDLGEKGITTLTYKTVDSEGNITGLRHYDVEGAVRREIVTANHNLVNEINKNVAEELEVEYLLLSEHIACRPQHFPWQGTIIRRVDLQAVTHYGEVDGMGGPNCKHFPRPYFGTARGNELKKITKEEAEEEYKLQQHQRYLERGVRKWKRKQRIFEEAEDKDYQDKCKNKVKEWQLRTKQFTENNNLRRDFSRENVEKVTNSKKDDIIKIQKKNEIPSNIEDFYNYVVELKDRDEFVTNKSNENGYIAGQKLNSLLGYDKLPKKVSKKEFNEIVDKSDIGTLYRGISADTNEKCQEYVDSFKNGKFYAGGQAGHIYGKGTYTGFGELGKNTAYDYARHAKNGEVIEMVLAEDAKTINFFELFKETNKEVDEFIKGHYQKYGIDNYMKLVTNLNKIQKEDEFMTKYVLNTAHDFGYSATIKGYDAIIADNELAKQKYVVVLNRGKVIISE